MGENLRQPDCRIGYAEPQGDSTACNHFRTEVRRAPWSLRVEHFRRLLDYSASGGASIANSLSLSGHLRGVSVKTECWKTK